MKDRDREAALVSLWLSRYPPEKRTADNVIAFYGWVRDNRPELLKHQCHDKFLQVKADLRNHIRGAACSEYESLENALIAIRSQHRMELFEAWEAHLNQEQREELIQEQAREEREALYALLDHAANHGCKR
jgi:hypothetical protein